MTINEELQKLEAQKELLENLLKSEEIGDIGKDNASYRKLIDTHCTVCAALSDLKKKAAKTVEQIELSFVQAFDLETQTKDAHRKIEVRKQNDGNIRFILTSTFKDGLVVQNYLHLGKNAFYLFQNAFHKASREFGFTAKDLSEYEGSQTNCTEYKFEEK